MNERSEIYAALESQLFEGEMNIFSGVSLFVDALDRNEHVQQLIESIRSTGDDGHSVYQHILGLMSQEIDPQYVHPNDAGIAALIYALCKSGATWATSAVHAGMAHAQLFWSPMMIAYLSTRQFGVSEP